MIQVLTTPGPQGLTQIQWIEKYHYDEVRDLLVRLEEILSKAPVMRRMLVPVNGSSNTPVPLNTISAQLEEMELHRIRAILWAGKDLVAAGYEPPTPAAEPDHK